MNYNVSKMIKPQRGFTLFEVLIVMVIVAIIAGLMVPKLLNSGDKALYEETRRLSALIGMASEQALMQGRDVGLSIENQQYHFYIYDLLQRSWVPLASTGSLRSRELPPSMEMELSIEESAVLWPEQDEEDEQDADDDDDEEENDDVIETPQVLLLSTGEVTPFSIYMRMKDLDTAFELISAIDGEREIKKHEYGL